jgi:hypothetical protein
MTTFKYFWGDKIKENKNGWACGTYGEEEKCIQGFGGEIRCLPLPGDVSTASF